MTVEKVELLEFGEFARRVGVTPGRISQLVSAGRIPIQGSGRNRRIVWPEARDLWQAERMGAERAAARAEDASVLAPSHERTPAPSVARAMAAQQQLLAARAADKTYQAEHRKVKLDLARKTTVLQADVDADMANVGALIRSTLQALPSKLAPRLAGQVLSVAVVERMLEAEVEQALTHLHESRYRPAGTGGGGERA